MSHPRGLSEDEQAAWDRLAESVTPLDPARPIRREAVTGGGAAPLTPPRPAATPMTKRPKAPMGRSLAPPASTLPASVRRNHHGGSLDSHWERKLKSGRIDPEVTLDLHDHGLDAAYQRLMRGMAQARAMGARSVLVIAGKSRPVDPADRSHKRGAIRAKLLDWLAASEHGSAVSAVRKAHRKHGGEGALYIVLRRER